jgi:hypothetical protein
MHRAGWNRGIELCTGKTTEGRLWAVLQKHENGRYYYCVHHICHFIAQYEVDRQCKFCLSICPDEVWMTFQIMAMQQATLQWW